MKFNQTNKVIILVVVSFAAYYLLFSFFKPIKVALDTVTRQGLVSYILTYFIVGIPIFLGTFIIDKSTTVIKSLGLLTSILTAIWTSILFVLPMFAGGLFYFKFSRQIDIENLIAGTLIAGFMEELFYRGFLFGQLFRKTNFGFILSVFFSALFFAFGHLYQSQNINELIGIFMITFFGAVFFAWLYVEWNYNLWVPILTHTFMNLSWNLFEVDNTALGNITANIFRGLTILTAVLFTIVYKRNQQEKLIINKEALILKKRNHI